MRTLITILVFTSILATDSFGQGYRGKRFAITYQPGYSMVDYLSFYFVGHHKLNLGYAVSKHFMINVHGNYSASRELDHYYYEKYQIKDITAGGSILYFRKIQQSYAPIGRYMGIGFDYGQSNSERVVTIQESPGSSYYYDYYYYDDVDRQTYMFVSAIFGRNYLIKERLLLGWGMNWGFNINNRADQPIRQLGRANITCGFIF